MATSILLSDMLDEFIASMKSNAYARNTVTGYTQQLRAFLTYVGNIQVRNVKPHHIDGFFAHELARGISPGTLNTASVALRSLWKYAGQRRYLPSGVDPMAHRRAFKYQPRVPRRLSASEFPALLDACEHPRDRITVALAMYLLIRQSEIKPLTLASVDLNHGEMTVWLEKIKKYDVMPISSELDRELRRWLTWYGEHCGPLMDNWHLVPAKGRPMLNGTGAPDPMLSPIDPTKPYGEPHDAVGRALRALGYGASNGDGVAHRDGIHTLRRSSARAMFDRLLEDGYDGAGRVVQSLLHHSTFEMTERYLGIELDKKRRDDIIRGKVMFPVAEAAANVTRLEDRRG